LFFDNIEITMSRGKPPAPAIPMTARQYQILSKHEGKHSLSHHTKTRIKILLLASKGQSNASVKRELGIDVNTVKKWRRRWETEFELIKSFEFGQPDQEVSDKELLQRMLAVLKDSSRDGAPKRITLAQKQQIVALACEKPQDYGIMMTQWTREMLAQVAKTKGIVNKISPRYVSEILKKARIASS
jgi:transposase